MNYFSDPCFSNAYHFARWSPTLTRPARISSAKKPDESRRPSTSLARQRLLQHTVVVPTEPRVRSPSPPEQPAPTPDLYSIEERSTIVSSVEPVPYFTPVRLQAATLTVPLKAGAAPTTSSSNSFAKESHERRKVVHERRLRKQQVQKYAHLDSDVWLQLKQSSAPLKRLTVASDELADSSTAQFSAEKYSFETLKQALHQQQNERKLNNDKSDADSRPTSRLRPRTATPNSAKRPTETFPQTVFEPFIVAAKPIHQVILTGNTHSSKPPGRSAKPPSPATRRRQASSRTPCIALSAPPLVDEPLPVQPPVPEESPPVDPEATVELVTRPKTASTASLKSTIKLDGQIPRCRSANVNKSTHALNKAPVRFILITDDEHRIESWYHRYPFIIGNDFVQSFQRKSNPSTIPAYFTEDSQHSIDFNRMSKGHLHDRPFHRENDWRRYDLILISQKIYLDVIIHLQTIVRSLSKSCEKTIHIRQVNQDEDLKTQVTNACRSVHEQKESAD